MIIIFFLFSSRFVYLGGFFVFYFSLCLWRHHYLISLRLSPTNKFRVASKWFWHLSQRTSLRICRSPLIMTYNGISDNILKFVATTLSGASRIDVVFDVYWPDSMKNTEIGQRSVGKIQLNTIMGAVSIKQRGAVLSDGNNKSNW